MKKTIGYSVLVFLLSTLFITIWYIMDVGSSMPKISFASMLNVMVKIGFYGATMVTILFLIAYLVFTKIKNRLLLAFCLIILVALLYFAFGWFLWYVGITGLFDDPIIE